MKVTSDIIQREFMGTEAKVAKSRHRDYVGISGRITDETRNTFTISGNGRKIILKDSAILHFKFDDGTTVEIDGTLLVGRPEDRLKKRIRRLW
jgi:ribonuclease P protein subunit POP4